MKITQNFWDLNLSKRYKKGPTPEGKKNETFSDQFSPCGINGGIRRCRRNRPRAFVWRQEKYCHR